jgi:hypothetical protein
MLLSLPWNVIAFHGDKIAEQLNRDIETVGQFYPWY